MRSLSKLAEHVPDMLRYRRVARDADVVHFQWLDVQWLDRLLLPRGPLVLTAHDLLPREPRPGQVAAQRRLYDAVDALVVHSEYGRGQLVRGLGLDPGKVHVIHHGAFEHLARLPSQPLAAELEQVAGPVVLFFGLLRPYKGVDVLLEAWRGVPAGAELWIVGRPRMDIAPLLARAPAGVRFVSRFVSDAELRGVLPPRRRRRAPVLAHRALRPVRGAGDGAGVRQADGAQRRRRLRRGRRDRRRRCWCRPAMSAALRGALVACSATEAARERLAQAARGGRGRAVLVGRGRAPDARRLPRADGCSVTALRHNPPS